MHFTLIDAVLERTEDRLVACKLVSSSEEYLQDHFPSFPVLPGVLMLEAMVQAARELVQGGGAKNSVPMVLGGVRALKYGQFVKPGCTLRVEVERVKRLDDGDGGGDGGGAIEFKGRGLCIDPRRSADEEAPVAVSGRFTLRPMRLTMPESADSTR